MHECTHESAAGSGRRFLPMCSECLVQVSPPGLELLPRFNDHAGLTRRYLRLVQQTVLNTAYEDFESADFDTLRALTMVGPRRLDNIDALIQDVLIRGVPGHFIECGCWRGGASLFAAAAFAVYDALPLPFETGKKSERLVFLADSFDGLPPVDVTQFPADQAHVGTDAIAVLKENSVELVERAAKALDVDKRTRFVPGFFNESLPRAIADGTFASQDRSSSSGVVYSGFFSILRLDGDLYQSAIEALHYLYPLLSVGGHIVVDDFTDWSGTRAAIFDYRDRHGLEEPIQITWHDLTVDPERGELTRGIWWTKNTQVGYHPLKDRVVYSEGSVKLPPH